MVHHFISGVRQGCVLAPVIFAVDIDIGVSLGESSFTGFDFADDVALLSKLMFISQPLLSLRKRHRLWPA